MIKIIKNSKSKGITKLKGITKIKESKPFRAQVSIYDNKTQKMIHHYVGVYYTIKEAKKARIKYILELF